MQIKFGGALQIDSSKKFIKLKEDPRGGGRLHELESYLSNSGGSRRGCDSAGSGLVWFGLVGGLGEGLSHAHCYLLLLLLSFFLFIFQ